MGKAGQALKQVLQNYNISQSALATALNVDRPIVFRWYHEQTDPTGETVAQIVQSLGKINTSAAQDFIRAFLGDFASTTDTSTGQDLPPSCLVDVSVLSQIFDNTTNSYKYLFFISILDILRRRNFDTLSPISFREIVIEMLANAWYSHNYFKLSFGTQDRIATKLDCLDLKIGEPILQFRDPDKKLLRRAIQAENIDDIVNFINRYVPFRLIRPFFAQETINLKDSEVNQALVSLSINNFNVQKPLYCFNANTVKDCNAIVLHDGWIDYIAKNYSIVRGWVAWKWLIYMQARNINTPNIASKIFMPQQRDSLTKQTKYWKVVLSHERMKCIYSNVELDPDRFSIDHYLPWSFVAHDQLWNLIPTTPSVNSSKSNSLPNDKYFKEFVSLQHKGLTISSKHLSKAHWLSYTESYIAELKLSQPTDLLDIEIVRNAYTETMKPLISLATIQGFPKDWVFQSIRG